MNISMNSLDNRVVLITGGSTGVGFSVAQKMIENGATVVITARNEDKLKAACKQLGEKAHYFLSEHECASKLKLLLNDDGEVEKMKEFSRRQFENNFAWHKVHKAYEQILQKHLT